jgi:hypothetical protein
LCASFLKILTGITFRGVILLARTRQPGHSGPGVPAVAARARAGRRRLPGGGLPGGGPVPELLHPAPAAMV